MSWLSALGGAASSLLAKGGTIPNLSNYGLGNRDTAFDKDASSIWALHEGVKRDDSSTVSIFVFDSNAPGWGSRSYGGDRRALLPLAKNALRKLRTLRHPDVLKFLDGSETDSAVYLVTEQVVGLSSKLAALQAKGKMTGSGADEWKMWGISRIVSALKFINETGASTHGNVRLSSVFTTPSGEWRLGGFELLSSPKDQSPVLYNYGGVLPESSLYASPECSNGFDTLRDLDPACLDAYQLHLLFQALFNPSQPLPQPSSSSPPPRGAIPASVFPTARQLALPNPRSRLTPSAFWELGQASESSGPGRGFIRNNRLFTICQALENFGLASSGEKAAVVKQVKDMADTLPEEFLKFRVLPSLVQSFEHGPDGPTLLPLAVSISSSLSAPEFASIMLQPLLRLYASPDRALRLALLDLLPQYAERLDKSIVSDKVWPNLVTGFGDTVPLIREATIKAVPLIAPRLSDRLLNNELLRHLAKTQMDIEPGIRTNTCILLSRLSKHLTPTTCRKVLVPAFGRSLRDPFTPARLAGLMSLMATVDYYEKEDLAGKVIPTMTVCLIDKEKTVRDQALKALEMFVEKVKKAAAAMPETAEAPAGAVNGANGAVPSNSSGFGNTPAAASQPGLAMSAAGAAGALAGWAFSSVSRKLTTTELSSTMAPRAPTPQPPPSAPASAAGSTVSTPAINQVAKAFTLPPGRSGLSVTDTMDDWGGFGPATDDKPASRREPGKSTWGGDLMDVEADADDWSTFETAPAPYEPSFEPLPATIDVDRLSIRGAARGRSVSTGRGATAAASTAGRGTSRGGARGGSRLKLGGGPASSQPKSGAAASSLVAALKDEAAFGADDDGGDAWGETGEERWETPSATITQLAPSVASSAPPGEPAPTDDWGGFDDAPSAKPSSHPPAVKAASAAPAKEDKAAQMARMRDERRAKMAALKAKKTGG